MVRKVDDEHCLQTHFCILTCVFLDFRVFLVTNTICHVRLLLYQVVLAIVLQFCYVSASVSVQFIPFQRMSLKRFTGMGFYIKNNHNKNWG